MMQSLYATDASVYRQLPLAVALPKHEVDIQKIVKFANAQKISLIPRGAGTSLAGQCVGDGIVVDVSKYMNGILEINVEEHWVKVQPGVIRDQLNLFLKPYGLFFGPNTSTANRCNIGGMVGNNSCGSTSIVYGSTRDHVLELKTILSDGSVCTFNKIDKANFDLKKKDNSLEGHLYRTIDEILSSIENKEQIKFNYPKPSVTRRNTGYALDALLNTDVFSSSDRAFNFCNLLCGSEGTLAFSTEIKLNLVPIPKPHDVVLAAHFGSIRESMIAAVVAMDHGPTACELMDKTILDCTKDNIEQRKNRFFIEGEPEAILMIEFRADDLDEAIEQADKLVAEFRAKGIGYAFPIINGLNTTKFWELRKAGLGLLANIPGDGKAVACIEDTAVAIEDLPDYIDEFSELMKSYDQKAVYYAHAGAGEIHLRPILNLKRTEDIKAFRNISESSAKLVTKYNGSLSGEHGDGRVRAEFIPLVLGDYIYKLLNEVKQSWDPNHIFNPGKIVSAQPMDTDLRYEPDIINKELDTVFNFDETGGILRTVEKCNGSGDCRKLNFAGGTMCPSYRATLDEKDSTRGRANILREFLTQNVKDNPFDHEEIKTAMDLCISCKGCKSECPSNIDMSTLKAEFLYQFNKSNKISLRSKLIANNANINGWLSKFSWVHNNLVRLSWFKPLIGFSKNRSIPKLRSKSFRSWFKRYQQDRNSRKLYLFCDEYTNYYDVEIGKKAVLLLNNLGYEVLMVDHPESGRGFISKGFLDQAKTIAANNISIFKDLISREIPLVGIEPSAILGFRDEYPNLVDPKDKSTANKIGEHVFLFEEFIANEIKADRIVNTSFHNDEKHILYHGHCHSKALSSVETVEEILELPSNYTVEIIPSGCCGMAGSFGYEKEHFDLSIKIGEQVLFPKVNAASDSTLIVASGTSCRHQIEDYCKRVALHPIEILYNALIDNS
jgi:FAD/FMN-containing dehydrogenase/Fe-S oxidoreductase